jgi:hypothetical protein
MTPEIFIKQLLDACDDIEARWNEHLEFWEGDEPGFFNEVSVFAHYVIDRYAQIQTSDFQAIFDIVEEAVNSKDKQTNELAVIGFLEGILFLGSHRDIRPECFEQWLGKRSKTAILDIEQFSETL